MEDCKQKSVKIVVSPIEMLGVGKSPYVESKLGLLNRVQREVEV